MRCRTRAAHSSDPDPASVTTIAALSSRDRTRDRDAVHTYTCAARAGYQLAKIITGLPDELLALIGRDQITDDAILGCPVPDTAQPILRAIEERHEPVLEIPWCDPRRAAREHHGPRQLDRGAVSGRPPHGRSRPRKLIGYARSARRSAAPFQVCLEVSELKVGEASGLGFGVRVRGA